MGNGRNKPAKPDKDDAKAWTPPKEVVVLGDRWKHERSSGLSASKSGEMDQESCTIRTHANQKPATEGALWFHELMHVIAHQGGVIEAISLAMKTAGMDDDQVNKVVEGIDELYATAAGGILFDTLRRNKLSF